MSDKKLRVAIITKGGLPVPNVSGGGVETLITYLLKQNEIYKKMKITVFGIENAEALLETKKYSQTTFVQLKKQDRTLFDRVRARIFKDFPLECPYSFTKVKKIIDKEHYDRILIENSPWQFPYFSKKFGQKVYLHLHNDWVNGDVEKCYQKRYSKAINQCGGVWAISKYIADRIKTVKGVNKEKIKVYYNATDIRKYSRKIDANEKKQLKQKYVIKDDDFVVLYTGRICEEKGVLELVQAFKLLNDKKIKLLVVGSVSYGETTNDDYTKKVKEEIGNDNRIIETGFVDYKDVYKYYSIANIQVIPSLWQEPFGLVAIEGMASKLAIISTNSGGLNEIFEHNSGIVINKESGIVEQLANSIMLLKEDKRLRETIASNAYELVNNKGKYDLENYYQKLITLLEK